MRVLLFFLVLFSTAFSGWSQQNLYILYDPTCMDRMKYESFGTLDNSDFINYTIKVGETERLFLEIGGESTDLKARIPGNIKTCSSPDLTKNLVIQINSGAVQAYTVRKTSQGYLISPVQKAAYLQTVGNTINYVAQQYSFQYDPARNSINENLGPRTADVRVYYVGNTDYNCLDAYLFQAVPQYSTASYSDLILIPEIGIVESRASSSGRSTDNNNNRSLQLDAINAMSFPAAYLADYCARLNNPNVVTNNNGTGINNQSPITTDPNTSAAQNNGTVANTGLDNNGTTYYDDETTDNRINTSDRTSTNSNYGLLYSKNKTSPEEFSERGFATTPTASSDNPCTDIPNDGVHVVRKNETLFRISKNNNITVQQIKAWNDLTSNLIYPCDKLLVVPPSQYSEGTGEFVSRGAAQFVQKYHVVQANESLMDIATSYGYTVERFREFNGLRPDEYIYVGQELKANDCMCPNTEMTGKSTNTVDNQSRMTNNFQPKGGSATVPDDVPESMNRSVSLEPKIHIVQGNETLYSIAERYNTTVNRLQQLNNLDRKEVVLPFQRIYVR